MGVTIQGKSGVALMIGSLASNRPLWSGIGSGSIAEADTVTGLGAEFNRETFTSVDISTQRFTKITTDYNAVAMSGNSLREIDLSNGSPAGGDISVYFNLGDAIVFDGTAELRTEINWEVF